MPALGWKRISWWIGGLIALAVLTAPDLAAAEHRVTATVQEPFEVNGELFPSGRVVLREISDYTPATTFNEVWINGHCLGLMLADVSSTPNASEQDRVIFERAPTGTLVLVGFAYRGQPQRTFYGYAELTRWSPPPLRADGVTLASR